MIARRMIGPVLAGALVASSTPPAAGQTTTGRDVVEALAFGPLTFEQPTVTGHEVAGVRVLVLEDHDLPLVSVYAYFRGGYGIFDREYYAPAMGLPSLLRYGGTTTLAPDSVDEMLEYYAIQTSFGTGGGSITSTVNTLTEHLGVAIGLWEDLLTSPGFDEDEIEVWRGSALEGVLRRTDDPTRLAFSEFNRLMYGDHPIGWEMSEADLAPERVAGDRFRRVHRDIVCRDNLVLGVTGDASWSDVETLIEGLVERVRPCREDLPEAPLPDVRQAPGVFLIEKDVEQAVIVMAHATDVRLADDPAYFSAVLGNSILGGGGFSSRITRRVRTEEGYAYSATSLWTTPRKYEGLLGAVTGTSPENTVPAIRVILETMEELRASPPTDAEVVTTVDRIVNGFVFNFDTPGQIVSRMMYYLAQDLPEDWLDRYWRGVQEVTPASIQRVFGENLRPDEMTILVVGDPDRIGREALSELGAVTVLEIR